VPKSAKVFAKPSALTTRLWFHPAAPSIFIALDEALDRLAKIDARRSRIVELRFFGGLSEEETAQVLGISARTVKRDWRVAKAWLYNEVSCRALSLRFHPRKQCSP
jgi:RNA polymerase sigma-70 factor, ECF subfamily